MLIDITTPVGALLTLGEPAELPYLMNAVWPDYLSGGLTEADIPALIELATNDELFWSGDNEDETEQEAESEDDNPSKWAPIHAWRALGQLHAQAAVEPLLAKLIDWQDDDWTVELERVFALIGPPALPMLIRFAGEEHPEYPLTASIWSIKQIGLEHPESRDTVVAALTAQLHRYPEQDEVINAFLISGLLDLDARETIPLVEAAFAADRVDESICGDWDEVSDEFSLTRAERKRRINDQMAQFQLREASQRRVEAAEVKRQTLAIKRAAISKKNKRKQAARARKQNRKR